ncbi:beta strand repeat-containing protein [Nostoc sp.]|uniref:beta strand repeat-containing protein n=1 Tax=Nostoc sp. TaxID=1180 RepID=UPI002FF9B6ED
MADIIGTNGNDTLNDDGYGHTLTGGGGNDIYSIPDYSDTLIIITDFGGVGKGINPSAGVIAEVDRLEFFSYSPHDSSLNARNLVPTQNGTNLEITFLKVNDFKVILQNFALENLDNLSLSTGATVDLGNIEFSGQTTITDSFDVFNYDSTQSTIFNKNTVTFLNDLNNNVSGFDNSDDVINGQGGDDIIDGKSGNDLLRGGAGNNTLIGGVSNDTLDVEYSTGNNILNGGTGDDYLNAGASSGNNLLSGGDGNDTLYTSYIQNVYNYITSSGNNTLNGGAGDDYLNAGASSGNNLLSGGDGNDTLSTSGVSNYPAAPNFTSSGNNTLNGGAGDDTLRAEASSGNNLLLGGDGNDYLDISSLSIYSGVALSSGNTLNGGAGDDTLRAEDSPGNNFFFGDDGNDSIYLNLKNQTVDGGKGDDLLSVDYSSYSPTTGGITTTFNPTTNIGSIKADANQVSYKNIERLNISGTGYNDNIVGNSGNDTLSTGNGGNDTIDGGEGEDVLSVDYNYTATEGITTTFNPTNNTGSIKAGTNQVSYKNIERLNISGTGYNDNIVGNSGNDTLSTGYAGNDTIDGGEGEDVLSVNYNGENDSNAPIATNYNATTNTGSIRLGTNQVNYKNIEQLNILGTDYNDLIVGNSGNDTLFGGYGGNDTLTGGAGNDKFVYSVAPYYNGENTETITDFGGVGKGSNPSATAIAFLDTLQFTDNGFTAQNLQLTHHGNNLEIGFENLGDSKVILQNFLLENLDNLPATSSRPAIGNILFYGQTSVTDSFDVFDANSTQTNLFNKNTVTFLNDLDNNITGFDDSNDVINGQGGNDIIHGLSGDDILRGGTGNDFLIGGTGNDFLIGGTGNDFLIGGTGDDSLIGGTGNDSLIGDTGNDSLIGGIGDDSLIGGTGDDFLIVDNSPGNNLLCGGNDSDGLTLSSADGNNTLNGGAGDDNLSASNSPGDNLLNGGDGNDSFTVSINDDSRLYGNNTLNGGTGDDSFDAQYILGNNLFYGGDGNDSFLFSARKTSSLVTTTVDGGTGDDTLQSFYYDTNLTGEITSAFNATTNIGSITQGKNRLNYKNIEQLDIIGTIYNDNIVGSNGNDTLSGSDGNDTLNGGTGDDNLSTDSSKGNSLMDGDDGNDSLSAFGYYDEYREFHLSAISGNNTLNGGAGDDNLVTNYSSGNNLLSGGNGNDSLSASGSDSLYSFYGVYTVSGNNTLDGGAGDDRLIVDYSSGANLLFGGDGNDSLSAFYTSGNNTLYGGNGNDILTGGKGNDSLTGGSGTDSFAFNSYNEGVDRLDDFNTSNELIQVLAIGFGGGLSIGSLKTSQFTLGTSATTSEERFIYNRATGGLFFDLDGSASGFTQVQFAQLDTGLSLTEKNFIVV